MSIRPSEYGSHGLVGVGVPQANPTVEQEAFALRPPGLSIVVSRLLSNHPDPEHRLIEYFERTVDYARQFDDLRVDAFGIACTGSSYLLGHEREHELLAQFSEQLGFRVISAAQAIRATLVALDAARISLVSPYPDWLAEKAVDYWTAAGFTIAEQRSVAIGKENIHSIYELRSADALREARQLDPHQTDAILFTGTGMATLGAINPLIDATGLPALSSNLCLISELARHTGAFSGTVLAVPGTLDPNTL